MDNNHRYQDQTAKPVGAAETYEFEAERGLATDDTILNRQVYGLHFLPIPIRHDIPKDLLAHIQKLYNRTVPVLSRIFPTDPCLSWYGATDDDGYAKAKPHPKYKGSTRVHRYIWQSCYGDPIDTIDHACGLKSCINLRHLRELDLDHNRKFGDPRKLNTEKGN
jgi:hypothetical protein